MNVGRYLRGEDRHVGTARTIKQPHADAIRANKARQRERDIERHLVKRVKELGGEVRKVQWIGRRGAPDRLVMLPGFHLSLKPAAELATKEPRALEWLRHAQQQLAAALPESGRCVWVELKAPGVKPQPHQLREHERMRAMGQRVVVIDSTEGVEELLR